MTVRRAREADLPALVELIHALAAYERMADAVTLDPEELRRHLFGPRPLAEVLVAEERGTIVGYALFFPILSTFRGKPGIHVEDLFVRPEHRGKGWGRKLLAAVAQLARERGCDRLRWDVLDWNEPAIRFYRRLGARPLEEWTIYRLEGAPLEALAAEAPPIGATGGA